MLQVVFESKYIGEEGFAKAEKLRNEFVIAAVGRIEKRAGAVNENLATGDIELRANELRILSESETPPFPIEEDSQTKDELRLKYRYLEDVYKRQVLWMRCRPILSRPVSERMCPGGSNISSVSIRKW